MKGEFVMTKNQESKLKNAMQLFKSGNFNESKKIFSEILVELPYDKSSIIYTGYIALLENNLNAAEKYFQKALELMPRSKVIKSFLADLYFRKDDYENASTFMNSVNRKSYATKLEYLKNLKVYNTSSTKSRTELKFLKKDPLPLVRVSINRASPVNFIIDTGGGELIIDTTYARSLALKEFGQEKTNAFGGGKKGSFIHSCIDSIQLGDFQVKNLPVILMDTKTISSELYGDEFRVDGILGTGIFYHFLTTMDYINEKVAFEIVSKDSATLLEDELKAEAFHHIPFWMASDHFMLAKGKVNSSSEMLFFIDTGLSGNSFTCPKSTIKECGFALRKSETFYGSGGGGKMKSIPFDIESLSLGGVYERNQSGLYGPFPPSIEHCFGFRIGGLISHEFFRTHKVIFDYTKMMLYLK